MGTTANYGWDYTDATDMLGAGFANDQTLAQAIDATMKANADVVAANVVPSYVHCDQGLAAVQDIADAAADAVDFGVLAAAGGWAQSQPYEFVYTGPTRLFLLQAAFQVSTQGASVEQFKVRTEITSSGTVLVTHTEQLSVNATATPFAFGHNFDMSTAFVLGSGSVVQVGVFNENGFSETVRIQVPRSLRITGLGLV